MLVLLNENGETLDGKFKLVPTQITEEMHAAAVRTIQRCTGNDDFPRRVFAAMLAAAPASQNEGEQPK